MKMMCLSVKKNYRGKARNKRKMAECVEVFDEVLNGFFDFLVKFSSLIVIIHIQ